MGSLLEGFDVCKLFTAFQICFCWPDLLKFYFDFLLYTPLSEFFLLSIFYEYWEKLLAEGKNVFWFFFFSTQDLRWIKMYAKLFFIYLFVIKFLIK